jgi:hypothetical protein
VIAPKNEELGSGVDVCLELFEPWFSRVELLIPENGSLHVVKTRFQQRDERLDLGLVDTAVRDNKNGHNDPRQSVTLILAPTAATIDQDSILADRDEPDSTPGDST